MNKREINKILKTVDMKVCRNSSLFDVNVRDKYRKYESM